MHINSMFRLTQQPVLCKCLCYMCYVLFSTFSSFCIYEFVFSCLWSVELSSIVGIKSNFFWMLCFVYDWLCTVNEWNIVYISSYFVYNADEGCLLKCVCVGLQRGFCSAGLNTWKKHLVIFFFAIVTPSCRNELSEDLSCFYTTLSFYVFIELLSLPVFWCLCHQFYI